MVRTLAHGLAVIFGVSGLKAHAAQSIHDQPPRLVGMAKIKRAVENTA